LLNSKGKESDDGSTFESRKRKDHSPPAERGAASHGDSNVHFHRRPPLATQDRNIPQNHVRVSNERRATRGYDNGVQQVGEDAIVLSSLRQQQQQQQTTPRHQPEPAVERPLLGNESQNTISSTDTVDAGRTSVQQTVQMQPVTLTQLSQSNHAKVAKKLRKTKHGGTCHHVQPGVPLASLQQLARNQPNAAPGQMVTVQVNVQVPREVLASNEETVKDCMRLEELRSASRGPRSRPGVQKATEAEFPNVKYGTIKKVCMKDARTGQQRYKKLVGANALTPVERAKGGKESVLSKEFLLYLFATIVFSAFSSNPLTDADIIQIIRIEFIQTVATYLKGSRNKLAQGKKLETVASYEDQQDLTNLYRQALTKLKDYPLSQSSRAVYSMLAPLVWFQPTRSQPFEAIA